MSFLLRFFDIFLSAIGLLALSPFIIIIGVLGLIDTGSPFFRQKRLGRNQQLFTLIKFRTMRLGTASLASHLAPPTAITQWGAFLRRTKLDELPQLWNVLRGDMSLVGPRPGLPNQHELTQARAALGVFAVRPGITGLAQVQGIDMSTPGLLAKTDALMLRDLDIFSYFKYIFLTIFGKGRGDAARKAKTGIKL